MGRFVKKLNLVGPQGPTGPQGPAASLTQVFLAAHPVGEILELADATDPNDLGGDWTLLPAAIGRGRLWKRIS